MKAIVHEHKQGISGLTYREMDVRTPGAEEVLLKVNVGGLNRRDVAVVENKHDPESGPFIPGSDASATIEETGADVKDFQNGEEVIIYPGLGWKEKSDAPPEGYEIVGFPKDGTFAEYIVMPAENVRKKPDHLTLDESGVLSLAALTAYRVMFTRGNISEEDTILLPGIGSGVLTYALKFAKAVGARVIVTSRSEDKMKEALDIGADRAVFTYDDWNEVLHDETIDVVVESIGGETFQKSIDAVRRGGTIVTFGATTKDTFELDIRSFFYGQYNLLGSTMGSMEEWVDMLQFIEKHDIHPVVDKMFSAENCQEAFTYIKESKNLGKIGIKF
ncbi:zinc-binding dehydrogenase [Salimicrobium salexigens]|uniref:Zinc-binding alcohol dehydrogenase/oxidoreductase n=1 Tax=Salimicrobium salexigens TaxID=908941 RepID=A0ABY1KQN1_9BACI|nr:zinc-binding dehydrogenase [Salimicrobium salexigens]SIS65928.1 zinc-binding alcohol dehydrogenase/oxidoreductase [Salimicrobium salexigens]